MNTIRPQDLHSRFAVFANATDSPASSPGARCLLSYQHKFGFSPHSLVSLSADAYAWESKRAEGAVAYLPVGRTWLASEPLAAVEDMLTVTREFVTLAFDHGALPAFVPVTSRFAALTAAIGFDCSPIGMSPYFDLASWTTSGRHSHGLRSGIRQAARMNVTVEEVVMGDWPLKEIEVVGAAWNASRKVALFGWVFAPDRSFTGNKRLFVARDSSGKLVAFATASPLPARRSFYLEDIQRDPNAPKGTTDLLFATAMKCLRLVGAETVTLGTVPLKGLESPEALRRGMYPIVTRGLNLLAKHGESVYNFAGVHTFKSRLSPTFWEHEYAAVPSGRFMSGVRVAFAAAHAIMPAGVLSTVLGLNRNGVRKRP